MSAEVPRIRMFAGPNGSGKSTIKSFLRPELLGLYINPDEIEREIQEHRFLDLQQFGLRSSTGDIIQFFWKSSLLHKAGLVSSVERLTLAEGILHFNDVIVNAYFASVTADFIRRRLLELRKSFTFETVMSSPDKIAFLESAQRLGYRSYLYYIATEDPTINIARVRGRVLTGGHSVPEDKIVARYVRSLNLLCDAIGQSNRSYLFDNSSDHPIWIAEFTDGRLAELKVDRVPAWFKEQVLDRLPT